MRISDWSSDVCSSDLTLAGNRQPHPVENFAITSAEFLQIAMQTARAGAELHRDRFLGRHTFDDHRADQVPHFIGQRRRTLMPADDVRSEEHTSELQSLMRISYAVFCLKKKKKEKTHTRTVTGLT